VKSAACLQDYSTFDKPLPLSVALEGATIYAEGSGTLILKDDSGGHLNIRNVFAAPRAAINILSVGALHANGLSFSILKDEPMKLTDECGILSPHVLAV